MVILTKKKKVELLTYMTRMNNAIRPKGCDIKELDEYFRCFYHIADELCGWDIELFKNSGSHNLRIMMIVSR